MGPEWTAPAAIRGGVSPACISLSWQLQEGSHLWSLRCCSYCLSCEGPKAELGATGSTVTEELGRRPLLVSLLSAAGLRISPSSLGFLNLVNQTQPSALISAPLPWEWLPSSRPGPGPSFHSAHATWLAVIHLPSWLHYYCPSQLERLKMLESKILFCSVYHHVPTTWQRYWAHRRDFVWINVSIDEWIRAWMHKIKKF